MTAHLRFPDELKMNHKERLKFCDELEAVQQVYSGPDTEGVTAGKGKEYARMSFRSFGELLTFLSYHERSIICCTVEQEFTA